MKHLSLNYNEVQKFLIDNENQNIYYDKIKIQVQYSVLDQNGNDFKEIAEENGYAIKINGVEHVIFLNSYDDSSTPYIIVEKNSENIKSIKVIDQCLFSYERECDIVNKYITKKMGINGKPFGNNVELNDKLSEHLETHKNRYLKSFKEGLIEDLNSVIASDKNIKFINLKNDHIHEMNDLFIQHTDEIYSLYSQEYKFIMEQERKDYLRKQELERELKKKLIAEKEKAAIKEQNEFSLSKFGYYTEIEADLKNKSVELNIFNKDNVKTFNYKFPLKLKEVEYFDNSTGLDEVFSFYLVDEKFENNINKSDYKNFYHFIFELKDSILVEKNQLEGLDIVANRDLSYFEGTDNVLSVEKKNSLSQAIYENHHETDNRLVYINEEMKEKFNNNNKLKI